MIDFHSHILPKMDDGSRSAEESEALLKMLCAQKVDTVVATPHFYANSETVSDFIRRRKEAHGELEKKLFEGAPQILLGAEVKYYQGISKMEELKSLCIGESKLLLLEMPFSSWTEYNINEIENIVCTRGITVVLAHIERYLKFQKKSVWDRLWQNGVLMQINADFVIKFFSRRTALKMLEQNKVQFLGSDCHNTESRAPKMQGAVKIISDKLGEDFIAHMKDFCMNELNA